MSDSEEENFCYYGKALDPYDEDLFPKKRPITVEEQIATDSQGRRRFHGAFTGGFSAGFFNTVGSLEGWTPSEFKSSRAEKQKHAVQNPEDFMDNEDMGEFGFAPQTVRATKDYDTSKKRKRKVFTDGPIPGEPVLHTLLTTGNETVGYLLLKNIGIQEKINTRDEETSSNNRVYGCEIPRVPEIPQSIKNKDYEVPDFYKEFLSRPKNDTFGLGYVGLDRSHVNLFKSSDLVVHEKDKKLSIRGQAFGVGAFENDDDDIYAKEDMSNYDFQMTKEKEKPINQLRNPSEMVLDLFIKSKVNSFVRDKYPLPVIPKSFTGKHKVKKSRFEPIETPETVKVERKSINAMSRAELLGEEPNKIITSSRTVLPPTTSGIMKNERNSNRSSPEIPKNSNVASSSSNESLLVPKKPAFDSTDLWNDRFVSAVQEDEATNILAPVKKYESEHYTKEMRDAAGMKLFGALTRISQDWQPASLLCKRFNIPEPMSEKPNSGKNRTRTKNLVFEYQKHQEENLSLKPGLTHQTLSNTNENEEVISLDKSKEETNSIVEVKQEIEQNEEEIKLPESNEDGNKKNEGTDNIKEENVKIDEIVDITDRLNIEEKGDMFKAIFMSSSESEGEEEEPDKNDEELKKKEDEDIRLRELELKSNIMGEELIILPKIKPAKEGILSGLDFKNFHTFRKPFVENEEKASESKMEESNSSSTSDINIYGPKLPVEKRVNNMPVNSSNNFGKLDNSSSDEWVEKDELAKHKRKKSKKEKSQKKKHKSKKSKKKH